MTGTEQFRHLPDLPLITWIAENNRSVLANISPWSKVVILVLLVVIVTVVRSPLFLAFLFASVVCACVFARLPFRRIIFWYTLPALFVLSLVGIVAWGEPGNPVFSVSIGAFTATLTDAGILLVCVLLLKALIIVTYSFLLLMTTRYEHLARLIDRIFPDPLNQIFLLSYRFLFLTISLTGSILKAVRSRGGGMIRSLRMQGRIFAQVFALTFIRSLDRAERVRSAMAARGYRGTYATATPVPAPSARGILCLVLATLGTAVLVAVSGSLSGGAIL